MRTDQTYRQRFYGIFVGKGSSICDRILPRSTHLLSFGYLRPQTSCQGNQICTAALIMCLALNTSIRILISLIALATANPYCSMISGHPNGYNCRRILNAFTGSRTERVASHCFAPAALEHPDDVTNLQWLNRVDIPKFWTRGSVVQLPSGRA